MMKYSFLILLILLGCQKERWNLTISGNRYQMLRDESGPKASQGNTVFFNYEVYKPNSDGIDSLMFNSRDQAAMLKYKMPEEVKNDDPETNAPIIELLFKMSKGDSAIVEHKLPQNMRGKVGASKLKYVVSLVDIK